MEDKIKNIIAASDLFLSDEDFINKVISLGKITNLSKDEIIKSQAFGIVITGKLAILNDNTVMHIVNEGKPFNGALCFGNKNESISIFAMTKSVCLLLSSDSLLELFLAYPEFLKKYMAFISDRISFLNNRIKILTSGSAEDRLYEYLSDLTDETNVVVVPTKALDFARALNMSRASLYRAFDILEDMEKIKREGKKITLIGKEK